MIDKNFNRPTLKRKAISPLEHLRSQREWNIDRLNRAFARKSAKRFFDFLTAGTGNKKPDTLLDMLKLDVFSCDSLIDVRNNPNSFHTPFWNKGNVSQLCALKGINYLHKPGLGVPSSIRKMLYAGEMTYPQFFEWYDANILVSHNLDEIVELTKKSVVAFMCTEIGPNYCHRHRIALRLESEFGYISYDL
jgi:uncharacterized protein (DUF488 family)